MSASITIFWFRRDLRLDDNRGLYEALKASQRVVPLFIFDDDILNPLPRNDHRLTFIYDTLLSLHLQLNQQDTGILVRKGKPYDVFRQLIQDYQIEAVYCNGDHEPYGMQRDEKVRALLDSNGVAFSSFIDHLVFGRNDVLKPDGSPYTVYTPYSKQWKARLADISLRHYDSISLLGNMMQGSANPFPDLDEIGFSRSDIPLPIVNTGRERIEVYDKTRDIPSVYGTTFVSLYLRFGTVSIRQLVKKGLAWNATFLNELIWREFFAMILWHFPHVVQGSFKPAYDRIGWLNDEAAFERWKTGATGFPMVDAGMRQLNASGYMHNRLRMITASFLTKHLLIDWRWGEACFAEKLYDFELSSNNGGWQWSAGTGCDAAPYFRIFNPISQQEKFDPDSIYIRRWIPELDSPDYPEPIVDLNMARDRCLQAYKAALREE